MSDGVRVDKWLWAARFFKTRSLAQKAVQHGQVLVDGQRPKPSRLLAVGQQLHITKGEQLFKITVSSLADKRGNAQQAARLYHESDAHQQERLDAAEARRASWRSKVAPAKRPDKRQRRELQRIKHQD